MQLKNNAGIVIIICLFIFANLIFLRFYNDVWWDSSVYIGMGKHIFSSGQSGLWEPSRPLVLSVLLGAGWALDFNVVYFGRFVSLVFSILTIFMVYSIGVKIFSKKTALLASFFTAFSHTFIFFSPNILTEIPSTFFMLLAIYFFFNKRFFLIGLFIGISVMTRLFQSFILIGLALAFFIHFHGKTDFSKKLIYTIIGISLTVVPYALLNYYMYHDVLMPFKVQAHLTKITGWVHYSNYLFYIKGMFMENFFIVFLFAIPLFFKRSHKSLALLLIPLFYIIIFSIVKQKEMRHMFVVLPYLYLLASYSLIQVYNKIKFKRLALALFSLMLLVWVSMTFAFLNDAILYQSQKNDESFAYFQNYIKNSKETIWVTSPLYSLYSDAKISGLLYFYSSDNLIDFINKNKNDAGIILYNNCDIPCPPIELDNSCAESREILDKELSAFRKIYEKRQNSCKYSIYERPSS